MEILETPVERFEGLPDYGFMPHWCEVDRLGDVPIRMHYVDEGHRQAPAVLLLHGEPSWSYLYRHMIRDLVARGYRAIAPDLVGFGRSSKPSDPAFFSYRGHVGWLEGFVQQVVPEGSAMFAQDWGGMLGLRVVALRPGHFSALCLANTGLPDGSSLPFPVHAWRLFAALHPSLPAGWLIQQLTCRTLTPAEVAAYDAPFPSRRHKAAVRRFPQLIPVRADDEGAIDNRAAWSILERLPTPVLTLFGAEDRVAAGRFDRMIHARMPGAAGQPHALLAGASHFLQEDVGPELVDRLTAWLDGLQGTATAREAIHGIA